MGRKSSSKSPFWLDGVKAYQVPWPLAPLEVFFNIYEIFYYTLLFLFCIYLCRRCARRRARGSPRTPVGISSLIPPPGPWKSNSGHVRPGGKHLPWLSHLHQPLIHFPNFLFQSNGRIIEKNCKQINNSVSSSPPLHSGSLNTNSFPFSKPEKSKLGCEPQNNVINSSLALDQISSTSHWCPLSGPGSNSAACLVALHSAA